MLGSRSRSSAESCILELAGISQDWPGIKRSSRLIWSSRVVLLNCLLNPIRGGEGRQNLGGWALGSSCSNGGWRVRPSRSPALNSWPSCGTPLCFTPLSLLCLLLILFIYFLSFCLPWWLFVAFTCDSCRSVLPHGGVRPLDTCGTQQTRQRAVSPISQLLGQLLSHQMNTKQKDHLESWS